MFGYFERRKRLRAKLENKSYRDAYVGEHVRRWIASQIRAMRNDPKREWNQGELARRMGKPQSVVSRLEDPAYGKMTVNTLLEVAAAFDVGLTVRFVDYDQFLRTTADLTGEAMSVASFEDTPWEGRQASVTIDTNEKLMNWAAILSAGSDAIAFPETVLRLDSTTEAFGLSLSFNQTVK